MISSSPFDGKPNYRIYPFAGGGSATDLHRGSPAAGYAEGYAEGMPLDERTAV